MIADHLLTTYWFENLSCHVLLKHADAYMLDPFGSLGSKALELALCNSGSSLHFLHYRWDLGNVPQPQSKASNTTRDHPRSVAWDFMRGDPFKSLQD